MRRNNVGAAWDTNNNKTKQLTPKGVGKGLPVVLRAMERLRTDDS